MLIHPDDSELLQRARALANRLASLIGETCTLEPKARPFPGNAIGLCYCAEKRISIVFRYKNKKSSGGAWWSKSFPWYEVARTVAHEVAHLKCPNHGEDFMKLEKILIESI